MWTKPKGALVALQGRLRATLLVISPDMIALVGIVIVTVLYGALP